MKTPKMRTQKLARSCRLLPREPPATDGGSRRTCPADGCARGGRRLSPERTGTRTGSRAHEPRARMLGAMSQTQQTDCDAAFCAP